MISPFLAIPIVAAVAALLLTPMTSRLALRFGWVDKPDVRKVHKTPVAYLGGAAVVGALLTSMAVSLALPSLSEIPGAPGFELYALGLGALLMFGVGLVDDIRGMRARTKLGAQLVAAGLVVASGVSVESLPITDGYALEFGIFALPLTILWIIGVTNAINIIDGLDGLASSLSIVAAAAIAWTAHGLGLEPLAAVAIGLMGAIIGFLPYNIHPARVFMGDAGSLTIGFLLASMSAATFHAAEDARSVVIPLVALGIPVLDTVMSMARRLLEGRSIMSPDRNHLHHRLMDRGHGQPRTVLILFTSSGLLTLAVTLVPTTAPIATFAVGVVAIFAYLSIFRFAGAIRLRESATALGRAARAARASNDDRQALDQLALRFKSARNLEDWWAVVGEAAERLNFAAVTLVLPARSGDALVLQWNAIDDLRGPEALGQTWGEATLEVPIQGRREGETVRLRLRDRAEVEIDGLGKRLRSFCNAIGSRPLSSLPPGPRVRSAVLSRGA